MFEIRLFTFGFFELTREEDELGGEAFEQECIGGGDTDSSETNNSDFECFTFEH